MDNYLDIEQAALHIGKSHKTLRRWAHLHKIDYRMIGGRYLFAITDLDAMKNKHTPAMDNAALLERLEAVESRLSAIETLLHERPASLRPAQPTYHTPPALRPTRLVHNGKQLPDGLVSFRSFSDLHNIAQSTTQRAIESGRLEVVRGQWKQGRAIVQMALDAAGRHRFIELFEGNPGFRACDACPHAYSVSVT